MFRKKLQHELAVFLEFHSKIFSPLSVSALPVIVMTLLDTKQL